MVSAADCNSLQLFHSYNWLVERTTCAKVYFQSNSMECSSLAKTYVCIIIHPLRLRILVKVKRAFTAGKICRMQTAIVEGPRTFHSTQESSTFGELA
jgi:hypothetical protein